jgi:eukaryotic-like serine/threonine-protein kinase
MQREVVAERFEIEELVGSVGMVGVYRARDRQSGEAVAIKVLHAGDAYGAARFMREGEIFAKLLAPVHHPGIVRYVAHGASARGALYLATEWLEGEDLAIRLRHGALTIEETVTLVARTAEALAAAHAHGIVHRNLKPSGLFLVDRDVTRIKLIDFEIAWFPEATQITKTGDIVGTPYWMAPEQARPGSYIDARADVFSLGCVLFKCLTGQSPFPGGHIMAILAKILFSDAPRTRDLRPEVPEALDALIAQMLAKDPGDRPRDGAAVAEALSATGLVLASAVPHQKA